MCSFKSTSIEIFRHIPLWLDQQADMKKHLLLEFLPTVSERAKRLLLISFQNISNNKPSELWDKICAMSWLPEIDDATKQHKELDIKKYL